MSEVVAPSHLTLEYAPRPRNDVRGVELDGETVLYEPRSGEVHKLDPVATVLWNCFDGSLTLKELSEDLGAVLGEDPENAGSVILRYVRDLGHAGLLAGVEDD